jgi:hypothetical protein
MLEVLDIPLMLFGRFKAIEGAQIFPHVGLRIFFPRIDAELP